LNFWHILKAKHTKEASVARALERMGCPIYLPLDYVPITISRRTRRTRMEGKPAISRIVFFQGPLDQDYTAIRHSEGLGRTGSDIWQVSDTQMRRFQEALCDAYFDGGTWLPMTQADRKAYRERQKQRNRVKSFAELVKLTPELFGVEA
jgi:hypothetical protein